MLNMIFFAVLLFNINLHNFLIFFPGEMIGWVKSIMSIELNTENLAEFF